MNANVTKTNGVKLFALVAVLAMVFAGAVVMMDDGVDAKTTTSGGTTYISGDVTATQPFGTGTNVVVDGDLVIPEGMALIIYDQAKFTVNAGATITIKAGGQLIFQGTPTVTINGNIIAEGTAGEKYAAEPTNPEEGSNSNASYYGAIVNNTTYDADEKTGFTLNGNITLEKGAELTTATATPLVPVAEGKNNISQIADINGAGDIVLGAEASIDVTKKSSNVSKIVEQNIMLNAGAILNLNGKAVDTQIRAVGTGSYYTAGAVMIDEYDSSAKPAGDAWTPDTKDSSELTFTVTVENTAALRDNPNDPKKEIAENAKNTRVTLKQFILNIDGTLANGDVLQTIAGVSCDLASYNTAVENGDGASSTEKYRANYFETDGMYYQILPKVSVTGTLTVENESAIILNTYSQLILSGTLDIGYDDKVVPTKDGTTGEGYNAASTIHGAVYITGSLNFNAANVTINNGGDDVKYENLPVFDDGKATPTTDAAYFSSLNALNKIVVDGGVITVVADDGETFIETFGQEQVYGTAYYVEGKDSDTVYVTDFSKAITDAIAAEATDVYNFAWGAQNRNDVEGAIANGATVIESDISIPADMTLYIYNALVVAEGATLTFQEDSAILIAYGKDALTADYKNNATNAAIVWVDGKVVDYDDILIDYVDAVATFKDFSNKDATSSRPLFKYEVEKVSADETYVTYTTLKIAIDEAQDGEVIGLKGVVNIQEDLTIPANVTVVSDEGVTVTGATLTVNGILDMKGTDITLATNEETEVDGKITVNNFIANVFDSDYNDQAVGIPGAYFNGTVSDDYDGVNLITSAAVAAANSATATSDIVLFGKLSVGSVTFTQSESALAITVIGEISGDITLAGTEATFEMPVDTTTPARSANFTGSVSSALTSGTATIDFSKASGNTVTIGSMDDGETVTTSMEISGTVNGTATISAGTIDAAADFTAAAYKDKVKSVITVGSGATLNVAEGITIAAGSDGTDAYATLVVEGTLAYTNGTFTNNGILDIAGTMTVAKTIADAGVVEVTGALDVAEDATVTIDKMTVGDKDGATGTVTGAISVGSTGLIYAFPGSNMSGAAVDVQDDGTSTANTTEFYINGELYFTAYSFATAQFEDVMTGSVSLTGYAAVENTAWFTTPEMSEGSEIAVADYMSDIASAYAEADPLNVKIQISVGQGMSVYIDNIRYGNGDPLDLSVGEHTISVQVNPGYTGTTQILFDGQTVTDGKLVVTADMAKKAPSDGTGSKIVLSVTGDISYETGSTSGDDGMGLTEILLIILVILIVVMAIMVALRLMRS